MATTCSASWSIVQPESTVWLEQADPLGEDDGAGPSAARGGRTGPPQLTSRSPARISPVRTLRDRVPG